jgi:hypothetical protein
VTLRGRNVISLCHSKPLQCFFFSFEEGFFAGFALAEVFAATFFEAFAAGFAGADTGLVAVLAGATLCGGAVAFCAFAGSAAFAGAPA